MLRNYVRIAVRNLLRFRLFSLINISGLAVSMALSMGIIMLVADQTNYDRYNTKGNRILRITTAKVEDGKVEVQRSSTSCLPLREELLENYDGIERVVRFRDEFGNGWIELFQNINVPLSGYFVDPEVFDVFEFKLQYGDPRTALKEPQSVVLTKSAASKLFSDENPMGKVILVGSRSYTVTGVLEESSNKTHVAFEALASMSTVENDGIMSNWTNYWHCWTYVLTKPGYSQEYFQKHLDEIYEKKIAGTTDPSQVKMKFFIQPLLSITLSQNLSNPIGPTLPITVVYFLLGLALLILLTSCFNYTNISIARSFARSKEIAIRKVTGATRWQIFFQFQMESIIMALFSLLIAILILLVVQPLMMYMNLIRMFKWGFAGGVYVYLIFFALAILVGLIAGFYPAVVLSQFQPVKILKTISNLKIFSRVGFRKILLTTQFTLSLFFISTVIIVFNQLSLFKNKQYGFNKDSNIVIQLNNTSAQNLKNEILKYHNIRSVTATSHIPAAGGTFKTEDFKKNIEFPDWTEVDYFWVDQDYITNMNLTLVAGQFFSNEGNSFNNDKIIINQRAVHVFNLGSDKEAIGKEILSRDDSTHWTVIGVVKNYNCRDLTNAIPPMCLRFRQDRFMILQVSYSGPFDEAVHSIKNAWAVVNPGLEIDYRELGGEINHFYNIVWGDIIRILGSISFFAILISCLGLLGMATYSIETRMKEIAIRRIFGSSSMSLAALLSQEFISMLGIAVMTGTIFTFLINNVWLQKIVYHQNISFGMIIQSVFILLLFASMPIFSQVLRAVRTNPVSNLKNE